MEYWTIETSLILDGVNVVAAEDSQGTFEDILEMVWTSRVNKSADVVRLVIAKHDSEMDAIASLPITR